MRFFLSEELYNNIIESNLFKIGDDDTMWMLKDTEFIFYVSVPNKSEQLRAFWKFGFKHYGKLSFEEVLNQVPPEIKDKMLFHLDLFV